MLKYKVGDKVKVMAGRDRGREGVIEKIFPKRGKAIVSGVNIYKKHVKKTQAKDGKGGVYELPHPIYLSKLRVVDVKGGKAKRMGFKIIKGKKERVFKK